MPRSKTVVPSRARRKKILKSAKGYRGGRSKLIRTARTASIKAGQYAYRDRKKKKGDFRRLWIVRINAAARLHGTTYSRLMNGLKRAEIEIDRKSLAHLAMHDDAAFAQVVEQAVAPAAEG
ncbi:MAG: 50S ribosomal protein L20 [Gemmatimonadetes bacterium]|nr:50S ribosomal protein L20 [Gemmatimonadota bacterium]